MPVAFLICGAVLVITAAARSTWSPCGWSMLSTITPLSERSRGHRFVPTASWFAGGALVGGCLLGSLGALGALGVGSFGWSTSTRLALAACVTAAAVAFDAGWARPALPHHRRQVNEDWLDEFRPWVYAAGFGVQIGAGLATYIMTGAVYLVVAVGAASGSWRTALALGAAFGVARGLVVFAGIRNTDPARLAAFHRRFAALDAPVRVATTSVLAALALTLAGASLGVPTAVVATAPVTTFVVAAALAVVRTRHAGATSTRAKAALIDAIELDRRNSEPTTA